LSVSAAAHLAVFAALLWPRAVPPARLVKPSDSLLMVSLAPVPKPPGPPDAPKVETTETSQAAPPRRVSPDPDPEPPMPPSTADLMSESQLAGAISVGEGGGGGGGCDTARAVQRALRRDPLVRTSVEQADRIGKAIMLWDGDWVRSGAQDGKGLSAVREAIIWEVAFAPEACRSEQVHGVVVLSLADGNTRFAIGSNAWRWSDLLGMRKDR
jgi:hypothetical protein